jgi:hypothetical protein
MSPAEIVVTVGGALLSAGLVWFFFGPKGSTRAEMRMVHGPPPRFSCCSVAPGQRRHAGR